MGAYVLKSAQFRREREASWIELEALVQRAETDGVRKMDPGDLVRLPALYRGAVGSLSVAQAISLDRNLLEYLANLAARAYGIVYATRRLPGEEVAEFLERRLPRAVRWLSLLFAAAFVSLLAGVASGFLLTRADPERYYSFVPPSAAQGRDPGASTETLRAALYAKDKSQFDTLNLFASFLFSHNAKIGMLCFALGFLAGVPVVLLLFYNGLLLGAMAALYHSRGLGTEFWAWVLPHGLTELLAVCLCGAAGLQVGFALVFPGRLSRLANLADRGRRSSLVVLGAIGMFFAAAVIEGIFRQEVTSVAIRFAVALTTLVAWGAYFSLAGRNGGRHG